MLSITAKVSKDIQLIAKSGHLWVAGLLWFKFYSVYLLIFSKIKIRQRNWKEHVCACTCYWNTGESPGRFSPGPRTHMYDHALRHYNISSYWKKIYIYTSNFILKLNRNVYTCSPKDLYKNVHSCTSHHSQSWKQTILQRIYAHNEIYKSQRMECLTNIILSKVSQTQEYILHEPFT